MDAQFKFEVGATLSPGYLEQIEAVFHGENLIQTILHSHLLIEQALTKQIQRKLARPSVADEGSWSFRQKVALYLALYDPKLEDERMLLAFNKLRNSIAHELGDPGPRVSKILPWDGETAPPEPKGHVWVIAAILLFHLGALKSIHAIDPPAGFDQNALEPNSPEPKDHTPPDET